VSKRGLPAGVNMRHDSHYVEDLARTNRSVGRVIPINQIQPNPDQPRVEIGDLTDLTASIKQNGVLEPILVKPNPKTGIWMIIAGERRWRASNLAGLTEIPCVELDIDDKSIAEIALIENLQRKDLTIWEESDGFAYLSKQFGYTHEVISKKIGKSRTTVTECMAIAGLPEDIRQKCRQAQISSKSVLVEIARQFDENAMHTYVEELTSQNLNRKKTKPTVKNIKKNFETTDSKNGNEVVSDNFTNTFEYSMNKDFILKIHFKDSATYDNNKVLRVLKEVFEKTKNPSSNL
jgi:ParB family chromosome partitioning protein